MSSDDPDLPDSDGAQSGGVIAETMADAAPQSAEPLTRNKYSESDLRLRFTSCGRCGFFIAAYRIDHNQEYLAAIEEIEAGWLTLPWHPDMRELVNKSYGCPIDITAYFFEGSCPECRRTFSYAELNKNQPALFLIKI
jgi:hypothetical protein